MNDATLRRQRLASSGLAPRPDQPIVEAVRVGLQAQDLPAARLAMRARTRGQTAASVDAAIDDGTIVRTWVMRGTLHLVASEDARWLIRLFGPRNAAATARRRADLGISDPDRAVAALRSILAGGPLTRRALFDRLNERDIATAGQTGIHLIGYAAHSSVLCSGPFQASEPTYVLVEDWLPAATPPADPAAEVAIRYIGAFGPATVEDFAHWSGLPAAPARAAWRDAAGQTTVRTDGAFAWVDRPTVAGSVCLLGGFDNLLLGYRDRGWVLPADAKGVAAGGIIHPAVLVDGVARGRWRGDWIEVFDAVTPAIQQGIDAELADVRRFGT